ncbi:secD: protein-export membrane protein SecD [Gaiella occulta]|uniref:Multifunctional fusion protein n=1 Tax=Gaiella occulta TaxID=1002870 RepID=A0A7M2YY32_9ACTN|nr:protein translocase subunit SecD [Gaiella occulta]RDI74980.1 secD: protein-export membrane protein SecD [Gaiella occulta]
MTRRAALVVVSLVVVALVGVALLAIPGSPIHKKTTLGLDLQGGLEVTLQAVPPKDRPLTKADLERSVSIMRDRVDRLGVSEPEIRTQGSDQIAIQLPGVKDPAAAAKIIGKTATLELYDLEANLAPPSIDARRFPVEKASVYDLLAGQQALAARGAPDQYWLFDGKKKLVAGPVSTKAAALRKFGGRVPKAFKLFAVPPGTVVVSCAPGDICPTQSGGNIAPVRLWYLLKYDPPAVPEMTGADLKLSGTRQDFDTQTNQPIVTMQFTKAGARKFAEITRREAQRGKLLTNTIGGGQKIEQHFAIVLDREIKSFPSIDWERYPGGISGSNGAQITGNFTIQEAKDLALVLQTGALPVKFVTLDQTAISATLGKDSLNEAKKAALIGLLVVALFLLLFYRLLGLVAVLGLGIYAAFLYAAILLFNVTLTLPGFAGLVLTLGVAADANVVIFERIKEESRAGRSVRAAIQTGYTKGFHTIVDANVVTAITALVLFAVATASVRGFALMLLIGTAVSMLTAVLATRALLSLLAGFKWFESPRFVGAEGRGIPGWLKLDYIGRRRIWLTISGVVVAVSIVALLFLRLNLGIDFKGGTQLSFKTAAPVSLEAVRAETARVGRASAVIQGRGTATNGKYRSFQLRTETLTAAETAQLQSSLARSVDAEAFGAKNVSSSFGRQIARSAIFAIVVSLLLIVGYISTRFQWQFAAPVIIALAHDVIITVGVYALVGREVTTSTVAAVLTVLGYSIYDTIIIFDRIRENVPLMKRGSYRQIVNVSLWETIPRSLATSFITLLPILALLAFGGDTLKDFAFALLIGIASGAYSSIFVAAPILSMIKEREPEYARRKHEDVAGIQSVGGVVVEAAPAPAPAPASAPAPAAPAAVPSSAKRERRRQRRSNRPHGRAR